MMSPQTPWGRRLARVGAALAALFLAFTCARWANAEAEWFGRVDPGTSMPALDGATGWLNSPPLARADLRGKVVLLDFWTYSCVNCLRTLPYVRAWSEKYRDHGLVVLGVHTPEFEFEGELANVRRAVKDLGIDYPVAVDSRHALWQAFGTRAWPTMVFVDATGRIRATQLGEGRYEQAERRLQQLLREAGRTGVPEGFVTPAGRSTQAAAGVLPPGSYETYLGTARADGFRAEAGSLRGGRTQAYTPARDLGLNQWTLAGTWRADGEQVQLDQAGGRIAYRFRARDLHLVLGPPGDGLPVRFRVRVDGQAPGASHGSDTDAEGFGRIDAQRLYQLVRQPGDGRERLFEIEFLDAGARAYAFTFG